VRARRGIAAVLAAGIVLAAAGCGVAQRESGRLLIGTAPENGAQVTVDGLNFGPTPVRVTGLRPGPAMVQVTREGYKKSWKEILVPEAGEYRLVMDIDPLVGYLTILSDPPLADIYLDDRVHLGQTPLEGKHVPRGDHTYVVRLENYEPARGQVQIQEDYRHSYSHILRPLPAQLEIFSRPTGAQIWVNEQRQSQRTPARLILETGSYSISVHTDGFIQKEQALTLGPNENATLEITMEEGNVPPGMILVHAGEFIMGVDKASPDERPKRKIFVDTYYIDRTEVTNAAFREVYPSHTYEEDHAAFPITGISFRQAERYAQLIGKRLPTEAEWEKAARGADGLEYPWGNEFEPEYSNAEAPPDGGPLAVGKRRAGASPYGCLDMSGNVYEWTSDWYQAYDGNTDIEKNYGQIFRVLRGGSYASSRFDVRCARRHYDKMDIGRADYGFRCVQDVAEGDLPPVKVVFREVGS
jgi:formylglycine-generating enzyme required for sulfatase activity